MKIVGGKHRGRPLKALPGRATRPTSDRVREAVFNILEHGIEGLALDGATVIDVFSGTGALGLEALSRGAARATFIDTNPEALNIVRKNAGSLGEGRNITALKLDAARLAPPPRAARAPCPLVFLDPPYDSELTNPALLSLSGKGWLAAGAVCVVEVASNEPFESPAKFSVLDERVYGAARVVFLKLN
ncbi:MAG TPA: 16S rRNA (guanine(966)-N(2))-methyltransferase RsmD [Rhodospirillales bacterium]|nr:16S rRNA (guanine(966)-N(2))-methyltransferase RsmD [Rhodospirillales bacterium]